MKYLIILLFGLYSCGAQFHLNKASKHQAKAIDKGAVSSVSNDTLYVNDTIVTIKTVKRNDTVFITELKTIEKIVYRDSEIRYITRKDKRKEVRKEKTESRRNYKLDKIKERTNRVVARSTNKTVVYWLIFVIIVETLIILILWKTRDRGNGLLNLKLRN